MEFWITIIALVRRQRVIIPAVLVALALGAVAYFATPKSYESSTTMVLTTTQYGGTESRDPKNPTALTNPMLNFNDSLRTTSAILIETANSKAVAKTLGVRGSEELIVNDGRTNPNLLGSNGPFLYIVTRSASPEEARRILAGAVTLIQAKLRELQTELNAPQKTYVSLLHVVPPSVPEQVRAQAIKLGLVALTLGLVLSIGIAYFRNQVRARRRSRAVVRAAAATTEPPRGDPPGPDADPTPSRPPALVPERDEETVLVNGLASTAAPHQVNGADSGNSKGGARDEQPVVPSSLRGGTTVVIPTVADLVLAPRESLRMKMGPGTGEGSSADIMATPHGPGRSPSAGTWRARLRAERLAEPLQSDG